jgi:propanol-preferring alcohol dehydrogenase
LCAGAVGYRSLRLADIQAGQNVGFSGFGASAHLVLQMVRHRWQDVKTFVFARREEERRFALELGASWTGDFADRPPRKLDRIIDTTPVWKPVLSSLRWLAPGGRLVINAIRKEAVDQNELLGLDYAAHLWMEKEIKSAANVTRADVSEFLALAEEMGIRPEVQEVALEDANRALLEIKNHHIRGAKVLRMD